MKTKQIFQFCLFGACIALLSNSCKPTVNLPKPRAYFKLDLPEKHSYQTFDSAGFPFTFEFPTYAKIDQDTNLIKEENQPYWVNVAVPSLNATVYLSYKTIHAGSSLNNLIQESFRLTNAQQSKADFIEAPDFTTPSGLEGVFYTVGGNEAASTYQFFVTDKQKNFIRGSLYFNNRPNGDSVKPAAEFLRKDVEHLINSLKFR